MKKIKVLSRITLFSVICLSLGSLSFTKSKTNGFPPINRPGEMKTGEDVLNVTGDTIQPPTAYAGFTGKNNCLFYNSMQNSIDSLCNKLDTAYIRAIYDTACKRAHGTNYVTVLQMKYGLHSGASKITLYFKALCLTRDTYNNTTKVGTYSDHNKFDSNYYSCGSQGFVKVSWKNAFQPDSANYAASMQIRHHSGGSIRGFYPGGNDTDDVSSVIYSFQEIYALIGANPSSHYIKVSNIVRQVTVNGIVFNKHEVIFGPNDLPPQKTVNNSGLGTYYNVYADFGNLCPPSCSSISYTLQ